MLLSACSASADAAEIYRWIGADGVVHYTDEKPKHESFATLDVAEAEPSDYDPRTDPYSITNQAQRLNATWRELARARAERRRRRDEQIDGNEKVVEYYDSHYYQRHRSYSRLPLLRMRTGMTRLDARGQLQALQALDRVAPRAHSINSGAHRARTQRSRTLPIVTPVR